MKTLMLFAILFCGLTTCAQEVSDDQNREFPVYANGLIYDESTMSTLRNIVDSLNLRFKTCDPKTFRGFHQGYARHFVINGDQRAVKKALNDKITPEGLLKQFSGAKENGRHYLYVYTYEDYRKKEFTSYSTLPLRDHERISIEINDRRNDIARDGWVYEEADNAVYAFFLEGLEALVLQPEYAKLVQYVDCLIDTTAEIYLKEKKDTYQLPENSSITTYLKFANKFQREPKMPELKWEDDADEVKYQAYLREYEQWNKDRLKALDEKMKLASNKDLLQSALDEALENRQGNGELEFYVARYLSPADALYLKRLRKPVGMCSMDSSPRTHAAEICKLAAQTAKWDIFLRAHLDIMNDNFDRRSDGSYAWAGRKTYLKELEMLDINAHDLLIGVSLRSSNTSSGHYFGDIGRIGRAFSESSDTAALESRLLGMIRDEKLDLFNRLLMAYLFDNHSYHLADEDHKRTNKILLTEALTSMPDFVADSFKK